MWTASPGPNDERYDFRAASKKFCMLVVLGVLDGREQDDAEEKDIWVDMTFSIKSKAEETGDIKSFFDDATIKKIHEQRLVFTLLGQLECQAEEEDVNSKNWPDLSCRDGYAGSEQDERLSSEFENCRYAATPGPNTPEGEYDSNWGICTKFCMLQVLRILDQEGEYHDGKFFVKPNAEEIDEYGYTDDFFDDASIKKIHAQCADLCKFQSKLENLSFICYLIFKYNFLNLLFLSIWPS
ncbi:unnamed protein product [Orchesella dallaii]|uniref:Uncharacterized protein n=1 Tax=Orchesella dallaii TaxID=48710 RepID=A0ABP1S3N9_9HEXA